MSDEAPTGEFQDNSYVSRQGTKHEPIPVQSDGLRVDDPIDQEVADSDEQLSMYLSIRSHEVK